MTTIYVTHDQIEAMTMGDRVAVMSKGYLQQVATPAGRSTTTRTTSSSPRSSARPQMNLVLGRLELGATPNLTIGNHRLDLPQSLVAARPALAGYDGRDVVVGIRPESLEDAALTPGAPEGRTIEAVVELREGLGSEVVAHARLDAQAPRVEAAQSDPDATLIGSGGVALVGRLDPRTSVVVDQSARFTVDVENLHLFDPETTQNIRS